MFNSFKIMLNSFLLSNGLAFIGVNISIASLQNIKIKDTNTLSISFGTYSTAICINSALEIFPSCTISYNALQIKFLDRISDILWILFLKKFNETVSRLTFRKQSSS